MIFKGKYRVTSGYRLPNRPDHDGIDLVGDEDKTVYCPIDGVVRSSTMVPESVGGSTWQWGNYVRVDDKNGNRLFFCHLESRAVSVGQTVKVGDKLGIMGYTGQCVPKGVGGTHTHFEVRKSDGRTNLDPAAYLGIPNKKGRYTSEKAGWVKIGSKWKYQDASGKCYCSRWLQEGKRWYWFGFDGFAVTGYHTIEGARYYFAEKPDGQSGIKECQMHQTNGKGALI